MTDNNTRRVMITGANRGLGLALTKAYLSSGDHVWGSARADRDDELCELKPTGVLNFDLADEGSIVGGVAEMMALADGLDLLINCAGIDARALGANDDERGPFDLDGDTFTAVIQINATGPMIVTREVLPLLRRGENPMVINISSQLGSMEFAKGAGRDTAYCVSKAALNMLSVKSAAALKSDGIGVVTMHPGWVSTDMGGASAPLSPAQSAEAIQQTVNNLTMADSGRFINWDGSDHPW